MKLGQKSTILMSIGLTLALLGGCGGGGGSDEKSGSESSNTGDGGAGAGNEAGSDAGAGTGNESSTGAGGTANGNDNITADYLAGTGVLVETKSDGTKLAWVNDTSTACLIYRIRDRGGNHVDGGAAHCQSLNRQNFGSINAWRMPTEAEAVYLMAHVSTMGNNRIIYPDDNPNCQFMATTESVPGNAGRYVYTTNSTASNAQLIGAFNNFDVQGKVRTTAGIRCVATQ
jgi:hypothetical protein